MRDAPPTPPGSSGRSARCSACARARLRASAGDSTAARVHRSTPPAASSRAIRATRCGHVSQNSVGNGVPPSSNGACSVTAGSPNGQRATTRRNARGGRPSCRSTISRSASLTTGVLLVLAAPGVDAADDEQPLPRLHEPEPPRLAHERPAGADGRDLLLELPPLGREQRRPRPAGGAAPASCGGTCAPASSRGTRAARSRRARAAVSAAACDPTSRRPAAAPAGRASTSRCARASASRAVRARRFGRADRSAVAVAMLRSRARSSPPWLLLRRPSESAGEPASHCISSCWCVSPRRVGDGSSYRELRRVVEAEVASELPDGEPSVEAWKRSSAPAIVTRPDPCSRRRGEAVAGAVGARGSERDADRPALHANDRAGFAPTVTKARPPASSSTRLTAAPRRTPHVAAAAADDRRGRALARRPAGRAAGDRRPARHPPASLPRASSPLALGVRGRPSRDRATPCSDADRTCSASRSALASSSIGAKPRRIGDRGSSGLRVGD